MHILILGSLDDSHAVHVRNALRDRHVHAHIFPTDTFPASVQISYEPHTGQGSLSLDANTALPFDDIHALFWRSFAGVTVDMEAAQSSRRADIAHHDSMATLRTLLNSGRFRCVNSWLAYQYHQEKPLQLAAVSGLGIPIPKTYVGNRPSDIKAFCSRFPQIIFKPVYGGSHTELITEQHLAEDHLENALVQAPITLQEYVSGTNIRTYVIGDKIFAAEIKSDSVDFREDAHAKPTPIEVPEGIKQQCLRIKQALHLSWTAIDWRRTADGEYFFLEANPSPMFIGFESMTGLPITDALIELLCSG
jgi:glutathione synthase/RimK-type ligase-like ATP-grasp enzyme